MRNTYNKKAKPKLFTTTQQNEIYAATDFAGGTWGLGLVYCCKFHYARASRLDTIYNRMHNKRSRASDRPSSLHPKPNSAGSPIIISRSSSSSGSQKQPRSSSPFWGSIGNLVGQRKYSVFGTEIM